jgi:hypothetical protein
MTTRRLIVMAAEPVVAMAAWRVIAADRSRQRNTEPIADTESNQLLARE